MVGASLEGVLESLPLRRLLLSLVPDFLALQFVVPGSRTLRHQLTPVCLDFRGAFTQVEGHLGDRAADEAEDEALDASLRRDARLELGLPSESDSD